MNLNLTRKRSDESGIFGELTNDTGDLVAYTLEHAYSETGIWAPKVPVGNYICRRGTHTIEDGKGPFETFEITNVPGHTGILFHKGNYNSDSQGCVLLGKIISGNMLMKSAEAFGFFMSLMDGVDAFSVKIF